MTFSGKLRVLIFAHKNRVRSMFLEFLYILEGGGNVFLRVFFTFFVNVRVLIFVHKNRVRSMFLEFF